MFLEFYYAGEVDNCYIINIVDNLTMEIIGDVFVSSTQFSVKTKGSEVTILLCFKNPEELFCGSKYEKMAEDVMLSYIHWLVCQDNQNYSAGEKKFLQLIGEYR